MYIQPCLTTDYGVACSLSKRQDQLLDQVSEEELEESIGRQCLRTLRLVDLVPELTVTRRTNAGEGEVVSRFLNSLEAAGCQHGNVLSQRVCNDFVPATLSANDCLDIVSQCLDRLRHLATPVGMM